jgi:hypothetical protein
MLTGGDGNRPLVDHTSSDEIIYFYIGAQFYVFFGRLGLNKTDDTLVAFDQLFLSGTAGFLATVSAFIRVQENQNCFVVDVTYIQSLAPYFLPVSRLP